MTSNRLAVLLLALVCTAAIPVLGKDVDSTPKAVVQGDAKQKLPLPPTTIRTNPVPVYQPPNRGAPLQRVSGGSRGPGASADVEVLAPMELGQTHSPQPTLYWYVSRKVAKPMELTIADLQAVKPLLETTVAPVAGAGFHRFRLADTSARLAPGIRYRWSVSLQLDPTHRSSDVIASGTIQFVATEPVLRDRLAQSTKDEIPFVLAESGFWYDAIETLSELMASRPADSLLRMQRAALLEQVGLPMAAAADRAASGERP